ncbi:hypothetical protein D3874_24395 [Oleomonas cavernae]|uniref:Uncharacterized protein n=1 Tax=Oleomonas cavernae TaxID=2320859 RepID=A0A418WIA8_9PROT|nr:hypothetical protein [Oleomonas cavernae]RJF89720.1 hypothetical protein D3874_24395 [Oleomonas cavernae]
MTENVENLILEHLRHLRGMMDNMRVDILEIKERLGILERQYASISNRVDRMDVRLDHIERRLGLVEA